MTVTPGQTVTVRVRAVLSTWNTLAGVRMAVLAQIASLGWLSVLHDDFIPPSFGDTVGSLDILSYPYNAVITLQLSADGGAVTDNDIAAAVTQAFIDASGTAPLDVNATGQDFKAPKPAGSNPWDAIKDLFAGLQGTAVMIVIALVLIAVVLAPHVGPLA